MARKGRIVAAAAALLLAAFLAGFVVFASCATQFSATREERADGIVVLTGGDHRLSEAARLLSQG